MKVRVSRMSKITAALVTILMVAGLAFSMIAYFENNRGGNDIVNSAPVEGATSMQNDTTAMGLDTVQVPTIANGMIRSMNSDGVKHDYGNYRVDQGMVYYDGRKRNGQFYNATGQEDTNANASRHDSGSWSLFPTRYLAPQGYGTYDVSNELARINPGTADGTGAKFNGVDTNDRLFGYEQHRDVKMWDTTNPDYTDKDMSATPTDAHKFFNGNLGKGISFSTDVDQMTGVAFYFTMVLPDYMVPTDDSTKLQFTFNSRLYCDNKQGLTGNRANVRRCAASYFIYAETNEGDITTPFQNVTTPNAMFYHEDKDQNKAGARWAESYSNDWNHACAPSTNLPLDVTAIRGHNYTVFNGDGSFKDNKVSSQYNPQTNTQEAATIPAGTRYLRFLVTWDALYANAYRKAAATFSDMKIKIWSENEQADADMLVVDNAQPKEWVESRDFNISINNPGLRYNSTEMKALLGKVNVNAFNPSTGETITTPITSLTKNTGNIVYLKSEGSGTSKISATNLWGKESPKDVSGYGYTATITSKTGKIWLSGEVTIGTTVNPVDVVTYKDAPVEYIDSFADNLDNRMTITPVIDSTRHLKKHTVKFKSGASDAGLGADLTNQKSPESLYYYELPFGTYNVDDDHMVNNKKPIATGDPTKETAELPFLPGGYINPDREFEISLTGEEHGGHTVVFFTMDKFNRVTLLHNAIVPADNNTGEVTLYVDQSDISKAVVNAKVKYGHTVIENEQPKFVEDPNVDQSKWTHGTVRLEISITSNAESKSLLSGAMLYLDGIDPNNALYVDPLRTVYFEGSYVDNNTITKIIDIDTNAYKNLAMNVVNAADTRSEQKPNDITSYAINNGKFEYNTGENGANVVSGDNYLLKRDDSTPTLNMFSTTTDLEDIDWNSGIKDFVVNWANTSIDSPMLLDKDLKVEIQYCIGEANKSSIDAWKSINVSYDELVSMGLDRTKSFVFYIGNGVIDGIHLEYSAQGQDKIITDAGNKITSMNEKIAFRIKLPNYDHPFYYDKDANDSSTSDTMSFINVMLDNEKPEVTITAKYEEIDLKQNDIMAYNNKIVDIANNGLDLPTDKPFWGTIGIMVTINNIDKILSRDSITIGNFNVNDAYTFNAILYDYDKNYNYGAPGQKVGPSAYFTIAPSVVNYNGEFAFSANNGAGIGEEFKFADVINYDNVIPNFTMTVGGKPINKVIDGISNDNWYNSVGFNNSVVIEDSSTDDGNVASRIQYVVKNGNVVENNPVQITGTTIVNNASLDAYDIKPNKSGQEMVIIATSFAGRTTKVRVVIGVDTEADPLTVNAKSTTYFTSSDKKVSYGATPFANKVSAVTYYRIIKDSAVEPTPDEIASLTHDDIATFDGNNVSFTFADTDRGDKYIYFVSKDLAGNTAVHEGTSLNAIMDERDYVLTLTKSGNGDILYGINSASADQTFSGGYPKQEAGAQLPVPELKINLKVGDVVKLDAKVLSKKTKGNKFVEYIFGDNATSVEPHVEFTVFYNANATLPTKYANIYATFKKIVKDFIITNNVQKLSDSNTHCKPKGFVTVGTAVDQQLNMENATIFVVSYFVDGQWTSALPQSIGVYQYKIEIAPGKVNEYIIETPYNATINISNVAVININFDVSNTNREYIFKDNVTYLSVDLSNMESHVSGYFIENFANLVVAEDGSTDEFGKPINRANDLLKFISGKIVDHAPTVNKLEKVSPVEELNATAKDAGTYLWTIQHTPTGNSKEVYDYKIDFEYRFTIVPRKVVVTKATPTITKDYDGTKKFKAEGEIADFATYLTLTAADEPSVNLNALLNQNLHFESFNFDSANVDASLATLQGLSINDANYVFENSGNYQFTATITPMKLTILYTNKPFSKVYDGTRNVEIALGDRQLTNTNDTTHYWYVSNGTVASGVDIDDIYLEIVKENQDSGLVFNRPNGNAVVGATIGKMSNAKVNIIANGKITNNYVIDFDASQFEITNANIDRKLVDISTTVETPNKRFDGNQFVLNNLNYNTLVGNDASGLVNGVPTAFGEDVIYKFGDVVVDASTFTWDKGTYTIIFGSTKYANPGYDINNDQSVDASDDLLVSLGDNYCVVNDPAKNVFSYKINAKELFIVFDETKVVNDMPVTNAKYFDAKSIAGTQTYPVPAVDNKNTVTFKVYGDKKMENIFDKSLVAGHTIDFKIYTNKITAGVNNIVYNNEFITYYNGEESQNYTITVVDDPKYRKFTVLKAHVKVTPNADKFNTFEYSSIDSAYRFMLNEYTDMTFTDMDNGGIDITGTNTALDKHLKNINNWGIQIMAVNNGKIVIDANADENGNIYNVSGAGSPLMPKYSWALADHKIFENFIFTVDDTPCITVKKAMYYITLNSALYPDDNQEYNDANVTEKLPNLNIHTGYEVVNSKNKAVRLDMGAENEITLAYFRRTTLDPSVSNDNADYTKVGMSDYGVGHFRVQYVSGNTETKNYKINNIESSDKPGLNNNILKIAYNKANGVYEAKPNTLYSLTVVKSNINLSYINGSYDYGTKGATAKSILDNNYANNIDKIKDIDIRNLFDPSKPNTMVVLYKKATTPEGVDEIMPYNNDPLPVGTYYIDCNDALAVAGNSDDVIAKLNNYKITEANIDNTIVINKRQLYVDFSNGFTFTKQYDGKGVSPFVANHYVDADGNEVKVNNDNFKISYSVQDLNGNPALNASNKYILVVDPNCLFGENDDKYYVDPLNSILPGTPANYTITKAPITISIARKDGDTSDNAVFSDSFNLVDSFKTVLEYDANLKTNDTAAIKILEALFGSEVVGTKPQQSVEGTAGFEFLSNSAYDSDVSEFAIKFKGITGIKSQLPNFDIRINEIAKFTLTKIVIDANVTTTNNEYTYDDENYNGALKNGFANVAYTIKTAPVVDIKKYLNTNLIITQKAVAEDKVTYKVTLDTLNCWNNYVQGDKSYGISYGNLYKLSVPANTGKEVTYDVKKKDLALNLGVNNFYTATEDVYTYGQADTENPELAERTFDPRKSAFSLNKDDKSAMYLFTNSALAGSDRLIIRNNNLTITKVVNADNVVYTISAIYDLTNNELYKITHNETPATGNKIEYTFTMNKPAITVNLAVTEAEAQYGPKFRDQFNATINGVIPADRDKMSSFVEKFDVNGLGTIKKSAIKFEFSSVGNIKASVDKKYLGNTNITDYYEVTYIGGDTSTPDVLVVPYTKAKITISNDPDYKFSKTYSRDNITDKTKNYGRGIRFTYENILPQDYKLVFKNGTVPVADAETLRFIYSDSDYVINTLTVNDPASEYAASSVFELNPDVFNMVDTDTLDAADLYEFEFAENFKFSVKQCELDVNILYPTAENVYSFEYGTTNGTIADSIKKLISVKAGTETLSSDIVTVTFNGDINEVLNVGEYLNRIEFTFTANDTTNYSIKNASESVRKIVIKKLPLYFTIFRDSVESDASRELYNAVEFGDEISDRDVLSKLKNDLNGTGVVDANTFHVKWYTGKNVGLNNVERYEYYEVTDDPTIEKYTSETLNNWNVNVNTAYSKVGNYAISFSNDAGNYNIKTRPMLKEDGKGKFIAVQEANKEGTLVDVITKFYYKVVAKTIDLEAITLDTNYGASANSIGNLAAVNNADNLTKLIGTAAYNDKVKTELSKRLAFKLDGTYTDKTAPVKAITHTGRYFLNYESTESPNIIINGDSVVVTINVNKLDISRDGTTQKSAFIKNENAFGTYNGKAQDSNIKIEFLSNLINSDMITYTINGAPGSALTEIIKDVAVYTIVVSIAPSAEDKFEGTYTFTYEVKPADFAKAITTEYVEKTFDNRAFDASEIVSYDTTAYPEAFIHNAGIKVTTKTFNGASSTNAIQNHGTYGVEISYADTNDNFDNFVNTSKLITVYVAKREFNFTVDNTANLTADYLEFKGVNINPNNKSIKFTHNSVDTIVDIAYDMTYHANRDCADQAITLADMKAKPAGTYYVKFALQNNDFNKNIAAIDAIFDININAKNLDYYLDKHDKVDDTTKVTEGVRMVQGFDKHLTNGVYEIEELSILTNGNTVTMNTKEKVFDYTLLNSDKTNIAKYLSFIDGYNIKVLVLDTATNKYVEVGADGATVDANNVTLKHAGQYIIRVGYTVANDTETNKPNVSVGTKDIRLNVGKANINKNNIKITAKYNGGTIPESFKYNPADLSMPNFTLWRNDSEIKFIQDSINYKKENGGSWLPYDIKDAETKAYIANAGTYKVNMTIDNNDLYGSVDVPFTITPLDIAFAFGTNPATIVYDTKTKPVAYETNKEYISVVYYSVVDGVKTKMKDLPKNVGSYEARAEVNAKYIPAGSDTQNIVIKTTDDKTSFKYDITKAVFDTANLNVSKYSGTHVFNGKTPKIVINPSFVSGLPDDAELTPQRFTKKTVGKYPIKVDVTSANYEDFSFDYGTMEITKADLKLNVESKTNNSITLTKVDFGRDVKVSYSIDGGKTYQESNVFKDLEENKKYTISVKVEGNGTKNLNNDSATIDVTTNNGNGITTNMIIMAAGGVGVVVIFGVVLGIVLHIKKKRKL